MGQPGMPGLGFHHSCGPRQGRVFGVWEPEQGLGNTYMEIGVCDCSEDGSQSVRGKAEGCKVPLDKSPE